MTKMNETDDFDETMEEASDDLSQEESAELDASSSSRTPLKKKSGNGVVVAVLAVLLGGGGYYYMNMPSQSPPETVVQAANDGAIAPAAVVIETPPPGIPDANSGATPPMPESDQQLAMPPMVDTPLPNEIDALEMPMRPSMSPAIPDTPEATGAVGEPGTELEDGQQALQTIPFEQESADPLAWGQADPADGEPKTFLAAPPSQQQDVPDVQAAPVTPAAESPSASLPPAAQETAVEQRLALVETSLKEMQARMEGMATKSDISDLRNALAELPKTAKPRNASFEKPETVKPRPKAKAVAAKPSVQSWVLKSAKFGEAWIMDIKTQQLRKVTTGDVVDGLGKISGVEKDSVGRWKIIGSKATLAR